MIRKLLERWLTPIVGWLKMNNLSNCCCFVLQSTLSLSLLYVWTCLYMADWGGCIRCLFSDHELILVCFSSSGFSIEIKFLLLAHKRSYATFLCCNCYVCFFLFWQICTLNYTIEDLTKISCPWNCNKYWH